MATPDTYVNSTPTLQATTTFGGVATTMDTCQMTLLDPNLSTKLGPIALTPLSSGFYQYTLPLGTLTEAGNWTAIWYSQHLTQSAQVTQIIRVGE